MYVRDMTHVYKRHDSLLDEHTQYEKKQYSQGVVETSHFSQQVVET
jgi:hypothetical protein